MKPKQNLSSLDQLAQFIRWAVENDFEFEDRIEVRWRGGWIVTIGCEEIPNPRKSLPEAVTAAARRTLREARRYWRKEPNDEIVEVGRREFDKRLSAIIKVSKNPARESRKRGFG